MKNPYFYIGPKPVPITGQANCYNLLVKHFSKGVFFYFFESKRETLREICKYYIQFIRRRPSLVYLSISRSVKGFLRDFLFLIPCFFVNNRIIFHLHGNDFQHFIEKLPSPLKWLYKIILRRIDTLIVLTTSMSKDIDFVLKVNPHIKIETVQNFYPQEFESLSIADCMRQDNSGCLKLLYFSNLIYSKGILDLIFAVVRCKEEFDVDLELTIAGEFISDRYLDAGSMENYFFQLIKDKPYIKFQGAIRDTHKKCELFKNSQVVVLPTFYIAEAFPLSLIEGMANANAIITTSHNNLSQVFPPEAGIFVNSKVVRELEEAIIFFSENVEVLLDTQRNNFDYARNNLSTTDHIQRVRQVLR